MTRRGLDMLHWVILVFCLCTVHRVNCYTAADMKTLFETIIPTSGSNPYYNSVRPKSDQAQAVTVTVDMYLIGINSFDNAQQKLTTTAYLEIKWTDEIMASYWPASSTIQTAYVPQKQAWVPDIALKNGFESLTGLGNSFLYVKVNKDGSATWKPYQVFESSCEIDVSFFPFDKTTCELQFIIWSNTVNLVNATVGSVGINTEQYEKNAEWNILSAYASNYATTTTSGVTFTLELQRKPLDYILNILLPVIMLGIINVFVFILPAASGEKTGFAVTVFLSFAVFLTIISTELPQNSEILSSFSAYLFIMTLVSTIIVVVTIFQLNVFKRSDGRQITRGWYTLSRCVHKIQCTWCCTGTGQVATSKKQQKKAEEVTWKSLVNCLDFTFFYIFSIFLVLFTLIVLCVSAFGG